jgi:hypothetical protein
MAKGYQYGKDFVPHDIIVKEFGTGKTRVETMAALGRRPFLVPNHKIMDGINGVRQLLPCCWFDEARCRDGLEALRQYQTEWSDKDRCFRDTPKHDWTSHAADAFRYLAMAAKQLGWSAPPPPRKSLNLPDPRRLQVIIPPPGTNMAIIFPPMCVRNTHGRLLRGGAEAGVAHDQLAVLRLGKQLRQLAQHYRLWPHIE